MDDYNFVMTSSAWGFTLWAGPWRGSIMTSSTRGFNRAQGDFMKWHHQHGISQHRPRPRVIYCRWGETSVQFMDSCFEALYAVEAGQLTLLVWVLAYSDTSFPSSSLYNTVCVQIFAGRIFCECPVSEDFRDFIFVKPYFAWRCCKLCGSSL